MEFNEISIREGHEYFAKRAASRKPKSAMVESSSGVAPIVQHGTARRGAVRCGIVRNT